MKITWQTYTDTRFQALQSLCKSEFETLLADFQPLVENYFRYHTLKGEKRVHPMYRESPNTSLLGAASKLFFILCYLKNNPLQEFIGAYFEMSQGKSVCGSINYCRF